MPMPTHVSTSNSWIKNVDWDGSEFANNSTARVGCWAILYNSFKMPPERAETKKFYTHSKNVSRRERERENRKMHQ